MMAMALKNVTSFKALFRPAALPNRTRFKTLGRTQPPSAGHHALCLPSITVFSI